MKYPFFRRYSGFSLIEMMIVILVISFLLAMTAPNLFSTMRASELSTQGDIFKNRFALAQQSALSSNADVEVRIYKFKDLANAQSEEEYRAIQFYQYNKSGELVPVSELFRLNDPLRFSEDHSSILEERDLTEAPLDPNLLYLFNEGVESVTYKAFRFRPDGSTSLPKTSTVWYLTMIEDQGTAEIGGDALKNYFCIQIDPFNGSLREYRPR